MKLKIFSLLNVVIHFYIMLYGLPPLFPALIFNCFLSNELCFWEDKIRGVETIVHLCNFAIENGFFFFSSENFDLKYLYFLENIISHKNSLQEYFASANRLTMFNII